MIKENLIVRSFKDVILFGGIFFKINYCFFIGGIFVVLFGVSLFRIIVEFFKVIRVFF